uniref:Uncharacterized protein n=1 Tax=Ananas comosus var. bracteatus TaxID=296719 RepID=A0A6V7P228_ANACO|nr:unnamed protein product [Ananas comosus var. bracteatus]
MSHLRPISEASPRHKETAMYQCIYKALKDVKRRRMGKNISAIRGRRNHCSYKSDSLTQRKEGPEKGKGVSSQGMEEHPNADLPLDPFNIEEDEEEPAFLPRNPKDLLITSMRKKQEEKDKDTFNLNRKLDEVLETVICMQTHMGVQQRNPEVQVAPSTSNPPTPSTQENQTR